MKLAGVVVLYNPNEKIIENIDSYINYLDKLYIIDNSLVSNQNKFGIYSNIEYIPNFKNEGIATALNEGAKKAIQEGYSYLLTMDQDSKFNEDSLKKMIDYICSDREKEKVAVYSPFHKTALNNTPIDVLIEKPLMVMTSGNIINLNVYEQIKGFKDWMFIDCVDFDYCLNARRNGYEIIQLNNVILEHELGDFEEKKLFGKKYLCDNHSAFRRYYIVRNSMYIIHEYSKDYIKACQSIKGDLKYGLFIVLMFEKDKFNKLKNMIKGYFDFKRMRL